MGNGTTSGYSVPTQVGTDTNWESVKAGFSSVLVGKLTVRYGHGDRIHTTSWA
ncbi:hypothetical protein H9W95_06350 [Flavobacterium lindanitolerans]|nr:hypothetical protein [Flavobacterium lindanitolerans]